MQIMISITKGGRNAPLAILDIKVAREICEQEYSIRFILGNIRRTV